MAMSEDERTRIMQEHEKQMVKLENRCVHVRVCQSPTCTWLLISQRMDCL